MYGEMRAGRRLNAPQKPCLCVLRAGRHLEPHDLSLMTTLFLAATPVRELGAELVELAYRLTLTLDEMRTLADELRAQHLH